MQAMPPRNVACFGPFELDLKAGELHRANGKVVRLREQPFQILKILIEHPGEVVTREELRRILWPNDTIVEFDQSINAAIKKLRLALEDSAENPQYVETVARRGYRLIVPVLSPELDSNEGRPNEVASPAKRTAADGSLIGKKVSHYRVLQVLGGGGMGVVYAAEDLKLGRRVALKFLPEELANDFAAIERFEREARAASALNHPNICTVYEVDEYDGRLFIAMELLEGRPLSEEVSVGCFMQPKRLLDIAVQVALGLEAAHKKGIIHRDIKPANMFITTGGLVKILDFGLAKLQHASDPAEPANEAEHSSEKTSLNLTCTGTAIGTASYMSPEQVRGEKLDTRTDLFSFGLVLYEMAAGKRAFVGETVADVQTAILNNIPEPVWVLNCDLPPGLGTIIERALIKDRERRYQSAANICADLKNVADDLRSPQTGSKRWRMIAALANRPAVSSSESEGARSSWPLAAVAALIVVGTFTTRELWHGDKPTPTTFDVLPVTSYPGRETNPSFSPDGSQIAFSWNGEKGENSAIYVKVVGENKTLRLTRDPRPEFSPAWSPDGRHIAFCRDTQDATEIIVIPALGGPEQVITVLPKLRQPGQAGQPIAAFDETGESSQPLAWFPEADSLAFVGREFNGGPDVIFRLLLSTGEIQPLTFPPKNSAGDFLPAISPDGHHLAFTRLLSKWIPPFPRLYVVALRRGEKTAGEPQPLTQPELPAGGGSAWTSDGRHIVFASKGALWSVGLDHHAPELLSLPGYSPLFPTISLRGNRLAFVKSSEDLDIWRVGGPTDASTKTAAPSISPTRLIASTLLDTNPQYSPDGTHIAFTSARSGTVQVWVCNQDGSDPVQVSDFDGAATPRWSPDGRYVAFDSPSQGTVGIYVIPVKGGRARRMTPITSENAMPSWSRDGKWLYFGSNRSGASQVWKVPFEGGPAVQVTHNGGAESFESRDGKFLYYAKIVQSGIWRIPTQGGAETLVVDHGSHFHWGLFDEGACLLNINPLAGTAIDCLDFETNRWKTVSRLPKNMHVNEWGPSVSVSPDGRSIAFVASERRESDIMVVENFRLPR
jgi:serine/threonine protein kinase